MSALLPPLLHVDQLSWQVDKKLILNDISFSMDAGEFVGVIGPNGAGKSSLMRCLYRVQVPSEGSVRCHGQDIWLRSAKENAREMAVILQENTPHSGLSVEEVIALGLTPHKGLFERENDADQQRIADILEALDLQSLRRSQYQTLSGGEKQRVMLGRAMLQAPQLLIMDEPTNHLDVHYQIELLQQVKALDLAVLASFHDLNLAAAYCDRILVLDGGKLVADGTPQDVLTESLISDVFKTCVMVDTHPLSSRPRISYAYDTRRAES